MDLSKIKDSKVLKVALIVALPTALVLAFYGYKYAKKNNFFLKKGNKDIKEPNDKTKIITTEKTNETK